MRRASRRAGLVSGSVPATAFYVVADSRHFLGLVALINSLRLVGHDESVFVGDCGLDENQRRRLEGHAVVVDAKDSRVPHLAKFTAPLERPSRVMVLMDSDMIVTRPLHSLVDRVREGKIIAFVDRVHDRHDPRWAELLGLETLRRQPYVNSGFVALEHAVGHPILERVAADCEQIEIEKTTVARSSSEYPFYYLDQDVLNAILASCSEDTLDVCEHRLAPFPPFPGLRVTDERTLRCSYEDGVEPYLLHHVLAKPWLAATSWSIYAHLLRRLLLAPDLAIRLRDDEVPIRLRRGRLAWLERRRSHALASLFSMRGRLGIRRRLAVYLDRS